jgi:hypothetical protein
MSFKSLVTFIVLGLIQILLLKNLALFGIAFCFLYLVSILNFPTAIPTIPLLLISFILGLTIDVFYETIGIHALSATFLAFLRPFWLKALSPSGGYDDTSNPTIAEMGIGWYISYAWPLVFCFCLLFFSADQWGTGRFLNALNKSFFSSTFTVLLAIIVQLIFFKRRRDI